MTTAFALMPLSPSSSRLRISSAVVASSTPSRVEGGSGVRGGLWVVVGGVLAALAFTLSSLSRMILGKRIETVGVGGGGGGRSGMSRVSGEW